MSAKITSTPLTVPDLSGDTLLHLQKLLHGNALAKLIESQGDDGRFFESFLPLMQQILEHLANGDVLEFISANEEIAESDAADFLNVPLLYYRQILDSKNIPAHQEADGRVVRLGDLQAYKLKRDAERLAGLREITRLGQDIEANA